MSSLIGAYNKILKLFFLAYSVHGGSYIRRAIAYHNIIYIYLCGEIS